MRFDRILSTYLNAIIPPDDTLLFDRIADALTTTGYCIYPQALPGALTDRMYRYMQELEQEEFRRAGIGRDQEQQLNRQVRGDQIRWLSAGQPDEAAYLEWMERLRIGINRRLMMGLFDYECHFSRYPQGAFYRRHLDAFKGRTNRVLSTVCYLNPDWKTSSGGELLIYADEQGQEPIERVEPCYGTLVVFLSDRFPHEVLPAQRERLSLTGWYRVNNSLDGIVDPPR